jgi:hypothetical protein
MNVFRLRSTNLQVAIGDMVSVTGRLSLFNGILMLDVTNPIPNVPFTSPFGAAKLSAGGSVAPVVRTLAQLDESVEGMLVRINDVRVIDGSIPSSSSNANLLISDGTSEVTLRILRETGISGMATPQGKFSVVGVVSQFDRFRPFDSGYQLLPRNRGDLILQ